MIDLRHGDCLDLMADIADGSVDLILADLPYGTTACKWDTVIPFAPLWSHYKRIIKPRGAIVLTASQPFTSALVMSNPGWFRYSWVWEKPQGTNPMVARLQPMKAHEDICVFYASQPTYNAQMEEGSPYAGFSSKTGATIGEAYGRGGSRHRANAGTRYPKTVRRFSQDRSGLHPTQKPAALMEYMIRTYTNEGETVLDNTMGSGTTGIACLNTGRHFIGMEKDAEIFETAKARIQAAQAAKAELLIA
jgi:hypothetical protein